MGSGFSFPFFTKTKCKKNPSYNELSENCIANIMDHLNPIDISKLAILNRASKNASSADFVWKSKLPINYQNIITRVFHHTKTSLFYRFQNKRDIFVILCCENSFDDDTKKVWLDKNTGKVCLSLSFKGLAITGIDDRRYWNRISTEESKFGEIAYLQQTWWFEVDGAVNFPFPPGKYSVFFKLQLGKTAKRFGRRICNAEHVHGWNKKPVKFQLSTNDGQAATSQCFLDEQGKWFDYHVGDFAVGNSSANTRVKFSMTQIDCTHTKGGVCIDSVVIYPSEIKRG